MEKMLVFISRKLADTIYFKWYIFQKHLEKAFGKSATRHSGVARTGGHCRACAHRTHPRPWRTGSVLLPHILCASIWGSDFIDRIFDLERRRVKLWHLADEFCLMDFCRAQRMAHLLAEYESEKLEESSGH